MQKSFNNGIVSGPSGTVLPRKSAMKMENMPFADIHGNRRFSTMSSLRMIWKKSAGIFYP